MSTSSPLLGRPADRTRLIVRELREDIVAGRLAPDARMPTREELERRFGAGATTVQRALEQLRGEGFVRVHGRQGTFVVPNPPHLTRYAMVFAMQPSDAGWVQFWTALANEVERWEEHQERPDGIHLPIYYGVDASLDSPDYVRLVREVQQHLVAGLIFTSSPHLVADTPLLLEAGVPRVAVMSGACHPNVPAVDHDWDSFRRRALEYLARRGCKKVAILDAHGPAQTSTHWAGPIQEFGLRTEPYWRQFTHRKYPQGARATMHLLFHPGQQERPDALVITDDNLVEQALAGIQDAGVRVPEELEVVAHCNFPWLVEADLPVRWLGFDARQLMAACVDSINRQRSGLSTEPVVQIPALFEDEVGKVF